MKDSVWQKTKRAAIAARVAWSGHGIGQESFSVYGELAVPLRYGENPHQSAALYSIAGMKRSGVVTAEKLCGPELTFNNVADADAGYELAAEFNPKTEGAFVAILKHATPCGAAIADTPAEAFYYAKSCDPESSFGGVVATNSHLDADTAGLIAASHFDVVIAPTCSREALEVLSKKEKLRLLVAGRLPVPALSLVEIRSVAGGFLIQTRDDRTTVVPRVVTLRQPTEEEIKAGLFAATIAKHAKSNAVVMARGTMCVGIGSGMTSRVAACRHAASLAAKNKRPTAVASDGYLPFPDTVVEAKKAGATLIVQPGGSKRDQQVIDEANSQEMSMVFTGDRHFKH